jgi:hypothetical protein
LVDLIFGKNPDFFGAGFLLAGFFFVVAMELFLMVAV